MGSFVSMIFSWFSFVFTFGYAWKIVGGDMDKIPNPMQLSVLAVFALMTITLTAVLGFTSVYEDD